MIFCFSHTWAAEETYSKGFNRGNDPFAKPVEPPAPAAAPVKPIDTQKESEEAGIPVMPADPTVVAETTFTHDSLYPKLDPNAPVTPLFKDLFNKCAAPLGCNSARIQICRHKGCKHNHDSCHNSGHAVDITHMTCNGQQVDAFHGIFVKVNDCFKKQSIDDPSRKGKRWKTLFRENKKVYGRKRSDGTRPVRRDCRGYNLSNAKRKPLTTECHWDHIHLSMQCRRGSRWSY